MDSIMGTKKKKKASSEKKQELIQVRIEVTKPGSKKYTHVDWEELLRKQGVEKDEETLRRFYDEDTLFMAKKLGETKSKSGKHIRVNLDHIQYLNRNCGYDMDDDFIDDTEAVDDMANASQKRGRFYVGKGEVKTMDEEEEEEEEEESDGGEEPEKVKKPRKKYTYKDKEPRQSGEEQESSSSSDSEPVRMTGAPPTARMAGGPPTKNRVLVKRPTPPKSSDDKMEKEKEKEKTVSEKKKVPEKEKEKIYPEIITIESESEPPAKKSRPDVAATASSSSTITVASTSSETVESQQKVAPSSSGTVAKKGKTEENNKPSTSSPPQANVAQVVTRLFQSVLVKLGAAKAKGSKSIGSEAKEQINELLNISKNHADHNAKFIETFASKLGVTVDEFRNVIKQDETEPEMKLTSSSEWKLSATDIPHFSPSEIESVSTIIRSWRSLKQFSQLTYSNWLKEVNAGKLSLDAARVKLYSFVQTLADKDKEKSEGGQELPKHERSRKARQFLPQWVHLSRKYVEMLIPTLKNPSTDGFALKQISAINSLKDTVKKQINSFEAKKDKTTSDAVYQFQFTEPVLTSIWTYVDELIDYSLAHRSLEVLVKGIDNLHYQCLEKKVTRIQFYIELCRRFQKLSFLAVEEPLKGRLAEANEQIVKHQVVQNPKFMIKWPEGMEPSTRGFNQELSLTEFGTSVLSFKKSAPSSLVKPAAPISIKPSVAPVKPVAPSAVKSTVPTVKTAASNSIKPQTANVVKSFVNMNPSLLQKTDPKSIPSTSKAVPTPTPLAPRQPSEEERRTMNQIVQAADICDPNVSPMSDELVLIIINAIAQTGVAQINQMSMVKNLLSHTGQTRMAQLLQRTKSPAPPLSLKDYQSIFEYFQTYEKLMEAKRLRLKEAEEKEKKRLEEKAKKELEKQLEREKERVRKEKEKAEERERKEREKREEKERKEREAREAAERKRMEEEDRRKAQERIRLQMEDERRKKEAQEMVEKELERRAKMETEAANALQFLEEDLLMDDVDFLSEQQIREDQERKIAEAKRAEERENQIKMMRAKQVKREEEEEVPKVSEVSNNGYSNHLQPIVQPISSTSSQYPTSSTFVMPSQNPCTSTSTFPMNSEMQHHQQPPTFPNYSTPVMRKASESHVDILNVAQQAAGLQPTLQLKNEPGSPSTPSAFDQLARLRGRTMSADVKRGQAQQSQQPQQSQQLHHQPVSNVQYNGQNNIPFSVPSTSSPLHHPSPQKFFPQSPISTNPMMSVNHHNNQMGLQQHNTMNSNNFYGNNQQRAPAPYQSPSSSLMHTPMSSDFSASPMSQQYHTPPSVGMMPVMSPQSAHPQFNNNGMSNHQNNMNQNMNNMNSYLHQQTQPPVGFPRMQPQMHRQISQQQLQMQQAIQQQQHQQMMRQHHYPPGSH